MIKTNLKRSLPFILSAILLLAGCSQIRKNRVIKLAHALNDQHPVHQGIMEMARLVEEISDGKMTMDVYANGQLGQERELLELLQIGSLDMTKVSAGALENFVPEFKVVTMPYLFQDSTHTWNVLQGEIGKELLSKGESYWMRGLCFYDAGSRSFYSKQAPIESPDDLAGLKVRVMNSQSAFDVINTLGGSPTPISFGELYTALQQGVVDAAENNAPSFFTSRHYEVCKYYSIDQHTTLPDVIMVGTNFWNQLSDQEKEWLQEAADRSVEFQKQVWKESVIECLDAVQAAGVQVSYPDKSLFQDKVQPMYEKFKEDPVIWDLIQKIKEAADEK